MWKLKSKKENLLQLLLSLGIVLISLILNPLINTCYALDTKLDNQTTILVNTKDPVVCFTEADISNKVIVSLENSGDYKEQIDLLKQGNIELERQITLLKEVNKLQQEQIEISKSTIESYKDLLKVQKEAYEKQIDNTKPSIWDKIFPALGGIGIGVLVGLLIL